MAYSFRNPSDGIIKHYLETSKIIAVVGLSDREDTTSHRVSKEMQERGYRIIPVNPRAAGGQILGETVYASLQEIPFPVDIVDVFYCIPSMPVIIIIGAAMDAMRVDSWKRMMYLMLILGFLGWPSIARLVRGQILSLREQEFMLATEACGIKVWHRIFRHLIPNVIPQLIVTCTMGLGSTILTEATLSFLGLGVKYPFASWGNIINDVNNAYVMTNYLFIWIPAGVCLLLTVLGFNFVGDGLRDAFDPKMKR